MIRNSAQGRHLGRTSGANRTLAAVAVRLRAIPTDVVPRSDLLAEIRAEVARLERRAAMPPRIPGGLSGADW